MVNNSVFGLYNFGQSIWLDNISRSLIIGGVLKEMLAEGLKGLTSNPTIFEKAVLSGEDYDTQIAQLSASGKSVFEIYDELTVKDIQDAADIFKPVYEETRGLDGYVSLEVNPKLADDADETIKEARRLYRKVNRPNLMLKVPATDKGFIAIEELTAQGMNVNATLIFSVSQYAKTAQAYLKGIKRLSVSNGKALNVRSVASIFVSRVDSVCDKLLEGKNSSLKGKAAVANCALIYEKFRQIFSSDDFLALKEKGANIQRVLWASTSTKNPEYSDIKYVSELIAKETINTLPQNTFAAFLEHGKVKEALLPEASWAHQLLDCLRLEGIDIEKVCARLLADGVAAFEKSFDSLLGSIEVKKRSVSTFSAQR